MNRFYFVFCVLLSVSLFDGRNVVIASLNQTKSGDDLSRFETLIHLAGQISRTNPEQAMEYAAEALAISEREQNQKMQVQAKMMLAVTNFDAQNFMKAIEYGKLCEPFFEKSDDVESLASLYNLLSSANYYIGNVEMSNMYSDKSIELAEKYNISEVLIKQYFNRGVVAFYQGDYSSSLDYALKALNIAKKDKESYYTARCYDLIGNLAKSMSEHRQALNYYELSRKIYLEEGDNMSLGENYINTAEIYEIFKQPDSVRMYYDKALNHYREVGLADGLAITYTRLARYYMQEEKKLDSAQIFIGKGLKAALLSESTKDLFYSYLVAGEISFHQGYHQKAMEYYNKALPLALRSNNTEQESTVKMNISRNYASIGKFDSAFHYLAQSHLIIDSLYRHGEFHKRAYAFAEHSVKERFGKEIAAERMQRQLWFVIVCLCVAVIAILCIFIWSMSVRQKKIKTINDELNGYKSNMEHILQDKTRELILSEQQILNLSNNLPKGAIFRFAFENACEGKTLHVSSGWEELTGQSIVEAEETVFFFHSRIHPDDSRELLKELTHAIDNHTILDKVFRFYKNNAELRWIHVRAITISGNHGLTYLDGYLVDETEQKHFEQELIISKNKAEESDKLKSAFLANMSHEIRTPMNVIIGFSDLLSNTKLSTERQYSYLELVQNNCRKLLRLIDDIVDISKIEADQLNLCMETFPLSDVMNAIKDYFEPLIDVEYQYVELWIDEVLLNSSLTVYSDIFRLKQIFMNLIDNALKFTEKGFVRCGQLFDRTDALHFYVMDTGAGISHENMENIFQSFRKVDQYSDGTGLGLSIVKRVLLQMGGSIWVESELGVGSTFHFTLPVTS